MNALGRGRIVDRRHLVDIGTGGERFRTGTREHDRAQRFVTPKLRQRLGKRVHERAVHHIQTAGIVDRDVSDAALLPIFKPHLDLSVIRAFQRQLLWVDRSVGHLNLS